MSKAELARRGRLPPETVRRLLTSRKANPHFSLVADLLRPAGLGSSSASSMFRRRTPRPTPNVSRHGSPAWARRSTARRPSKPRMSRQPNGSSPRRCCSPVMMRAWRARYRSHSTAPASTSTSVSSVDWRVERGQGRTLGLFSDLTAELSGDRSLAAREARPLLGEARRRVRASQFFKLRSATERRLAELKTPAVARRWGFRMNMSADSFASMFGKAARVSVKPKCFRGAERDRTVDLLSAIQALSQLSYSPNTLGVAVERGDILRRGLAMQGNPRVHRSDACGAPVGRPGVGTAARRRCPKRAGAGYFAGFAGAALSAGAVGRRGLVGGGLASALAGASFGRA